MHVRFMVRSVASTVAFAVLSLLLVAASGRSAIATEIEGVLFPERYEVAGAELELKCVGLLRYKVLFRGYVAALYLEEGNAGASPLADVPKRLELSYFWSIDGEDFGPAGETVLERNFDTQTIARLRPQLDEIKRLYEDVEPGDRYSLTYVPGLGTELALNGEPKGVLEGTEFGQKYFAIWLGEKPIDSSLKEQLVDCPGAS